MGEFLMPSLGADMDSGTIVEWLVKVGDEVQRGDIVAVVDTDKSDIDVEVFEHGIVDELLVPEGERVPVGTALARLRPVDAPARAPASPAPPSQAPAPALVTTSQIATPHPITVPAARHDGGVHSPVLRRLAAHLGVDLTTVVGTGPDGRVTRDDIEAAAAAPGPARVAPPETGHDRSATMRRAIADLMARSKREIPHYAVATTVDAHALTTWLAGYNAARPVTARVLPAAVLLKAAAVALREVPDLNGTWTDGDLHRADDIHLGVAIRLRGGGLIAPAIHDADRLGVDDLMQALNDLVQRARGGHLRSSEMADPTFTVTMLGDQGVDSVTGVIYPPQVGLLGLGRIVERPWAVDGMLGVRPVLHATLAADHRATDGLVGARYLNVFDRLLQCPQDLAASAAGDGKDPP